MTHYVTDIAALNRLVNRADIRPHVAGRYHNIDMSSFLTDSRNVVVGDQDGALIFAWVEEGWYTMHYLLTEKIRGKAALDLCRTAINDLFTNHDALAIVGSTPDSNRAARIMNHALGGKPVGVSVDTLGRSCTDFILERKTWEALSAESSAA